jgi:uncharacterized delta-60 repeat protein
MFLNSWLKGLRTTAAARTGQACRSPGNAPQRFRPRLEGMDDRSLPSGGLLDPTFGTGGLVTTAIGSSSGAMAVATYPSAGTANDGKIVAVGYGHPATGKVGDEDMAIARYNLNGTPDPTFGGNGVVLSVPGRAMAVVVQPDGKALAAGTAGGDFIVVRYNANGTPDTSFGSQGQVITTIGRNSNDTGEAMVLQPDGRIVVAGVTNPQNTTYQDLALVRYNANGTLDNSYGTGGKVTTRFAAPVRLAGFSDRVNLAIDPNTSALDPTAARSSSGHRRGRPSSCGSTPTAPWTRPSARPRVIRAT